MFVVLAYYKQGTDTVKVMVSLTIYCRNSCNWFTVLTVEGHSPCNHMHTHVYGQYKTQARRYDIVVYTIVHPMPITFHSHSVYLDIIKVFTPTDAQGLKEF